MRIVYDPANKHRQLIIVEDASEKIYPCENCLIFEGILEEFKEQIDPNEEYNYPDSE